MVEPSREIELWVSKRIWRKERKCSTKTNMKRMMGCEMKLNLLLVIAVLSSSTIISGKYPCFLINSYVDWCNKCTPPRKYCTGYQKNHGEPRHVLFIWNLRSGLSGFRPIIRQRASIQSLTKLLFLQTIHIYKFKTRKFIFWFNILLRNQSFW